MYGVLDLCLGCKACKSECPSAVDMAKIKAEYLVHYYRENGLPLFNRLMGMLPTLNALLYKVAPSLVPLVNWSMKTSPAKAILTRIGFIRRATYRIMPKRPLNRGFRGGRVAVRLYPCIRFGPTAPSCYFTILG